MRLAALHLTRFGHFNDFTLDLPRGEGSDFHIVLGPNEAGKSTIVEGWLNLLYGIPARTTYAFRHDRDTLQVSARIEDGGTTQEVTRLRKASASLLGPDGAVLPEAAVAGMLRGVTEAAYRHLYCLDDETIEAGGEDILASKGDLGQLLFAAASGLAAFNERLAEQREADRGFHVARGAGKRGSTLAGLRRKLDAVDTALKEADVTAPAYRRLRETAEAAQEAEERAKERHAALVAEAEALRAAQAALPVKADLAALRDEVAALGPQPALAPGVPAEMDDLAQRRTALLAEIAARRSDMAGWRETRDRLALDTRAEGLADALVGVQPLRARAEAGAEDMPRRQDDLDAIMREAARLLAEIGLGGVDPGGLGVTAAGLDRLDSARQGFDRAAQRLDEARRAHVAAEAMLGRLRDDAPEVRDGADAPALEALLQRLDAVRMAGVLAAAESAEAEAARAAQQALAGLSLGGRVFGRADPVPMTAAGAKALAAEIEDLTRRLALADERVAEEARRAGALLAEMGALQAQGAAPGDAEAAGLRTARDRLWAAHRAGMSAETAEAYAAARTADDQAGALRLAEAARLTDLRRTERDHARAVAERDARAAAREVLAAALAEAEARLAKALAAIGLPEGLSAGELAEWLGAHAAAAEAGRISAEAKAHAEIARAQAAPVAAELAAALHRAGGDLAGLVAEAEARMAEAAAQADLRMAAERALAEAAEAAETCAADLEAAEAAQDAANTALAEARAASGVDLPKGVAVAAALPVLRKLLAARDRAADMRDRIGKMAAARDAFAARMTALAAPWPELAGKDPLEQAAALDRIAEAQSHASVRHRDLGDDIARAGAANDAAGAQVAEIEARAAEVALAWAPDDRPEGFAAVHGAVRAAAEAARLGARIATEARALVRTLGAESLEAAEARLEGQTEAGLRAAEEVLAPELAQAAEARDAAIRALGLAEQALADVSGDGAAAALAQDRRLVLEDIQAATEAGLTRRIGLILAERALVRYRDQHRGAMLAATEAAFVDLTGGAYTGLSAQPEGGSEVLIAHRARDGRSLRADEKTMSKGTRFQLYLALRLAGYRQMAAAGTVLPFLCDDIFETFDEARTAAACRLLSRIGEVGQAIYFTHHAHVAEIARRDCPGVQIHAL